MTKQQWINKYKREHDGKAPTQSVITRAKNKGEWKESATKAKSKSSSAKRQTAAGSAVEKEDIQDETKAIEEISDGVTSFFSKLAFNDKNIKTFRNFAAKNIAWALLGAVAVFIISRLILMLFNHFFHLFGIFKVIPYLLAIAVLASLYVYPILTGKKSYDFSALANDAQDVVAEEVVPQKASIKIGPLTRKGRSSFFDGSGFIYLLINIGGFLVTVISLGFCASLWIKWQTAWRVNHTVINGHRMQFDGKATQLFGRWIIWWLLSIITLGIYGMIRVVPEMNDWINKHTTF